MFWFRLPRPLTTDTDNLDGTVLSSPCCVDENVMKTFSFMMLFFINKIKPILIRSETKEKKIYCFNKLKGEKISALVNLSRKIFAAEKFWETKEQKFFFFEKLQAKNFRL